MIARRGWIPIRRSYKNAPELLILVAALLIDIICITAIAGFTERIEHSIDSQASDLLGGNLVLTSDQPIPPAQIKAATQLNLQTAQTIEFLSVISAKGNLHLANIKAVSSNYPLRGKLTVWHNGVETVKSAPKPGNVWVAARLLPLLGTKLGGKLKIGSAFFTITHSLASEPDRFSGFISISPRVLMNTRDVARTQIVQPGSRVTYNLLLAGEKQAINAFSQLVASSSTGTPAAAKLLTARTTHRSLRQTFERSEQLLNLAGLISVLLAGIAMGMAMRRFIMRQQKTIALLRCFGQTRQQIKRLYTLMIGVISVPTLIIGCLFGYIAQIPFERLIADTLTLRLVNVSASPALFGFISGLLILCGFTYPALANIKDITPLQLLREEHTPLSLNGTLIFTTAMTVLLLLIYWHLGEVRTTLIVIITATLISAILMLLGQAFIQFIQRLRPYLSIAWRYGLANLQRHRYSNTIQILVFGLTIMMVLLVTLIQKNLFSEWRQTLPKETPNYFAVNIAPHQITAFQAFIDRKKIKSTTLYPIVRGRITRLNKKPILQVLPESAKASNALYRALNLTWQETLPRSNKIVDGHWWITQTDRQQPLVSIEQGLAERLNLNIGDVLGFRIGAQTVEATITNIRTVNWTSFKPSFYFIFPPGYLNNYPTTYMTSFYLPADKYNLLNELVTQFPNITPVNITAILRQSQQIINKMGLAIGYLTLFVFIIGLIILLAAIYTGLDERLREHAILKTLGMRKRQIAITVFAEFFCLGGLSGLLGATGATITSYALCQWVLSIPFNLNTGILLFTPLTTAISIGLLASGFLNRFCLSKTS